MATTTDLPMVYEVRVLPGDARALAHWDLREGDVVHCYAGHEMREGDLVLVRQYTGTDRHPGVPYRARLGELGCVSMGEGAARHLVGWTLGPAQDGTLWVLNSEYWEVVGPALYMVRVDGVDAPQGFRLERGAGAAFPGDVAEWQRAGLTA